MDKNSNTRARQLGSVSRMEQLDTRTGVCEKRKRPFCASLRPSVQQAGLFLRSRLLSLAPRPPAEAILNAWQAAPAQYVELSSSSSSSSSR
eukprot:7212552-Heterocapsa_arctica.AAC.1